jgi:hypothetical protein
MNRANRAGLVNGNVPADADVNLTPFPTRCADSRTAQGDRRTRDVPGSDVQSLESNALDSWDIQCQIGDLLDGPLASSACATAELTA